MKIKWRTDTPASHTVRPEAMKEEIERLARMNDPYALFALESGEAYSRQEMLGLWEGCRHVFRFDRDMAGARTPPRTSSGSRGRMATSSPTRRSSRYPAASSAGKNHHAAPSAAECSTSTTTARLSARSAVTNDSRTRALGRHRRGGGQVGLTRPPSPSRGRRGRRGQRALAAVTRRPCGQLPWRWLRWKRAGAGPRRVERIGTNGHVTLARIPWPGSCAATASTTGRRATIVGHAVGLAA